MRGGGEVWRFSPVVKACSDEASRNPPFLSEFSMDLSLIVMMIQPWGEEVFTLLIYGMGISDMSDSRELRTHLFLHFYTYLPEYC